MTTPHDSSKPSAAAPRSAAERYLDLWERHLSLTARDGRLRRPPSDEDGDASE